MEKRSNRWIKMNKIYIIKIISEICKKSINNIIIKGNKVTINIKSKEIGKVLEYIKKTTNIQGKQLMDISGVDYPERGKRFELNYIILSIKYNVRIEVKVGVGEEEGIETVSKEYVSAGWLEREVWDMYGVYFKKHKDLRRILTDYGFSGYPLRKDFPLSGYVEVRYDDEEKSIVLEPIEMVQEFRYFHFLSPWEKK